MSKGLPGLSHVDHVGLTVPELDIAVKFYCDVIGGNAAIFQYPELFVSHVRLFLEEQSARKIQSAEAPPLSDETGPSEILSLAHTEASP